MNSPRVMPPSRDPQYSSQNGPVSTAPLLVGYVPTAAGVGGDPALDSSTGSANWCVNANTWVDLSQGLFVRSAN